MASSLFVTSPFALSLSKGPVLRPLSLSTTSPFTLSLSKGPSLHGFSLSTLYPFALSLSKGLSLHPFSLSLSKGPCARGLRQAQPERKVEASGPNGGDRRSDGFGSGPFDRLRANGGGGRRLNGWSPGPFDRLRANGNVVLRANGNVVLRANGGGVRESARRRNGGMEALI
jgi:hypothetical protein